MTMRICARACSLVWLLAALFPSAPGSCAGAQAAATAVPLAHAASPADTAQPAQKLKLDGLPNLGKVASNLYRGGQPKATGYPELKKLGIQIVVSFRDEPKKIKVERRTVEALGLRYVSIPWRGTQTPKNSQVAEFLELVRANQEKRIFAHCRRGAERTGVMIAAYRMAFENWTPPQALEEMEAFRFHGLWFRHLKRYVQALPQKLAEDPTLRGLSTAAQPTAP